VTLGDDIRRELPALRAAAESMMTDTAEVYGLAVKTWVEETSSYDEVAALVWSGKCRLKLQDVQTREVDAQGQALIVQSAVVSFPVAADTVFPKDYTVTLTASEMDPALVGKTVRITGPHAQTYATARRYPVEEVS
jgi:hypothetical protein